MKKCKRRIKWTGEEFTLMANPKPHINLEPRTEPPSHINLQLKPTGTELKLQTEPKPQVKSFLFCSKGSQDNPCSLMKNGTKKRKPKGLTPFDPDTIRVQRYYCRTHQRFFTEIPSSRISACTALCFASRFSRSSFNSSFFIIWSLNFEVE